MRRSGNKFFALLLPLALLSGCLYGFAGGGLPPNIKTVAILPFDNQTPSPNLQQELFTQMRRDLEGRLGVREASESKADAIVRGSILRYEADIPAAYSADPTRTNTTQRKLQITVDVEIIDQTNGRTLWSRKGLVAEGTYPERSEESGRRQALQKIVDQIVAGAQSQW